MGHLFVVLSPSPFSLCEFKCVCVCVCVCARARARVRACVRAVVCLCSAVWLLHGCDATLYNYAPVYSVILFKTSHDT